MVRSRSTCRLRFHRGSEPRLVSHGGLGRRSRCGPRRRAGDSTATTSSATATGAGDLQNAVRIGGQIPQPQKTTHVNPVYPPIAQSARVQGVVIIEAIIDRDGKVGYSRILRSIPLLDQAALDAVNQWEFTQTRLNGSPVPVIMTVTVQFTLQ